MKRFWREATLAEVDGGLGVSLDGRPLKTPARAILMVPHPRLAEAIVAEWSGCGEELDPRAMPMTGLANAAIDRVALDRAAFAKDLTRYAEADLTCYRAEGPASLIERQAAQWDPILDWAGKRFGIAFAITSGLIHVPQPRPTVERLSSALTAQDSFRLAALSPIVTIGGSLVTALALLEKAIGIDQAVAALTLDEQWQLDRWGHDDEAAAALAARASDIRNAARFLDLLGG